MVTTAKLALDKVHVSVRNLGAMRTFYTEVLGFEEEFYHEGEMAGLQTGGAALVLTVSERPSSGVKLVLSCIDIEHILDILTARGVAITQPLWEGHWGAKAGWIRGPRGEFNHP